MTKSKLFFLICFFWKAIVQPVWAGDAPHKVLLTDFKFTTLNQFLIPNYFQDSLAEGVIFEKAVSLIRMQIGECEIATYQPEKIRYDNNTGDFNLNKVPRDGYDYFVQIASQIEGFQDVLPFKPFQFETKVRIETPDGKEVFNNRHKIPFNIEQEDGGLFDERLIGKKDFTDLYIQSLEGVFSGKEKANETFKFTKPVLTQYEYFLSEAKPYAITIKVGVFGKKLNFNDLHQGKNLVVEMKDGIPVSSGVDAEGIYEKPKMRKNYTVNYPLAKESYKIKTLYKSAKLVANFITFGEPAFTLQGIQDKQEIFYFQAGINKGFFDNDFSPQTLTIEGFREGNIYLMNYNIFSNFLEIRVNDALVGMILMGKSNFDEISPGAGGQYHLYIKEGAHLEAQIIDAFLVYMICNDILLLDVEGVSNQN
jgi:hypothetical protein